jgi:molybdate transport system ATP-binding protein
VALARALARKPRVLLLDEPFSAVDLITRRKLRKDLVRVRRALNIPIVLVTHDLDEAYQLADNLSIVHHGTTLHSAKPDDFINRPVNAEVARLTGQTNIFDGVIESHHLENGITRISWQGRILECLVNADFQVGEPVQWVIPQNRVILHQRVRPSRGEAENPVDGQISEMMKLGDSVALELLPDESNKASLSFTVPLHVAERNALAIGERIGVSLKTQGIHLMRRDKRVIKGPE